MASVTISVANVPEALSHMRRELARILRMAAKHEDAHTRERMERVAVIFETGQSEDVA